MYNFEHHEARAKRETSRWKDIKLLEKKAGKINSWVILTIIFVISTVLRGSLANNVAEYITFYDELVHSQIAKNLAAGNGVFFRGAPFNYTEILYSVIIAPAFILARDLMQAHQIVLWINAALMSSVVYPVYLIARKYLKRDVHIWILVIYSVFIGEMCYTLAVIQENLNYPLMMWYFVMFSHCILERRAKSISIAGLGILSFLLSVCKQMNLAVIIATFMFFIFCIIVEEEGKKQNINNAFIFAFTVIVLKGCYSFFMSRYLKDSIGWSLNLMDALKNAFQIGILKQILYPAILYFFLTIIATGIFPILISIGCWNRLDRKERNFLRFVLFYMIVSIGAICVLIVPIENLGQLAIRYHSRYYFYTFIIFLMFFLVCCEKFELSKSSSKGSIILLGVFTTFLTFLQFIPIPGKIDSISMSFTRLLSENNVEYVTLRCLLVGIVILGAGLLYKRYFKQLVLLTVSMLVLISCGGSFVSIYFVNEARISSLDNKNDALLLNDFFAGKDLRNGILLIGENIVSDANFECYLGEDYRYTLTEDLMVGELGIWDNIILQGFNCQWRDNSANCPDYMISKINIPFQGYDELEIGLQRYHLFKLSSDNAMLRYRGDGIYNDGWIEGEASLEVAGKIGCSEAALSICVDNILIDKELEVIYSDGCGHMNSFIIQPTSEPANIQITVRKEVDSEKYYVKFMPQETKQPENGDTRQLSFRFWGCEIIGESLV